MENTKTKIYKELPYYLFTNDYKPCLKISRRRILKHSNIHNYMKLLEKTDLDKTYFYSDNIQKIIKNSLKIK